MGQRKRNTSKKRESILSAATRVFVSEGYDRSSMDHIAEVAGASKRTVYNHFPSKEELFREVIDRFMSDSHELKQIRYDSSHSLEAQLALFADSMVAITRKPAWLGLMKVMTGVAISRPALVGETLAAIHQQDDTLAIWLQEATADGRLHIQDPEFVARAFWAMLGGAFLLPAIYAEPAGEGDTAAMKEELISMFLARYTSGQAR